MTNNDVTSAAHGTRHVPAPPRTGLLVAGLFVLAALGGLAAALQPVWTLAAAGGLLVLVLVLTRVEWAAALVVAAASFEDYLRLVHDDVVKLLAAVLVVGWVARRIARHDRTSLQHPLAGAALALTLVLLASTALQPNLPYGFDVATRYAGFLAVLVVLLDLLRRGMSARLVVQAYVVACTAAAAAGVAEFVVGNADRVGGPLEDPNDLAFFLIVAIPLAIGLRARARRPRLHDLAVLVLVVGTAGTLSRGAAVGLVAMVAFALVTRQVRLRVVLGLAAVAAVVLGVVALTVPERVDESLGDKASIANQNADDRLGLWRVAGEMTLRNPVLGLGPGGFAERYEEFAEGTGVTVSHNLTVAHNMYLETAADLGLLGLAVFVALLGIGMWCAMRRWRHDREPLAAAVATATAGAATAAMFISEQYFLPVWMLAALGAGLWPLPEPAEEEEP